MISLLCVWYHFFDKHKFDPRGDAEQVWRCCPGYKFDHQHGHSHSIVKNILWTSVSVSVSDNQYIYIFCNYIYNITYIHIYIYISQYLQEHGARWIICGFTDAVKRSWCIFGPPDPRAMASCYCAASINPFNIVFLFQIRWIYVNLQIDPVIVLVLANSHQIPFFFSS